MGVEITNKMKCPTQVLVRSYVEVPGSGTRAFTCLNIPGIGAGNNKYIIEDERHLPIYTDRLEKKGMISVQHIPNKRKED